MHFVDDVRGAVDRLWLYVTNVGTVDSDHTVAGRAGAGPMAVEKVPSGFPVTYFVVTGRKYDGFVMPMIALWCHFCHGDMPLFS